MIMQERNPELVDILRADFQHRNEPNFAWKSAVSTLQNIPGVLAAWPMSVNRLQTQVDRIRDVCGGGLHLRTTNVPLFGYDNLISYVDFDGVNQYASLAAGAASWASVLGTEAHIVAACRGLLLGCWVKFDGIAAAVEHIIGKWDAANQCSYRLSRTAGGNIQAAVSLNGAAVTSQNSTATVGADAWTNIILRYDPGAELSVFVNGAEDMLGAGVPASIFDSTSEFTIGELSGGVGENLDGKVSQAFLGAMFCNDGTVFSIRQQQRAMFGV